MKKKTWKTKIKKACIDAGTYRPYFEHMIDELAGILEHRDMALNAFNENGGNVIVEYTNKNGSTNMVQNPALRLANDLNRDALAYWRDLGLTPAGLKKINEKAMEKKKISPLAEAMRGIG